MTDLLAGKAMTNPAVTKGVLVAVCHSVLGLGSGDPLLISCDLRHFKYVLFIKTLKRSARKSSMRHKKPQVSGYMHPDHPRPITRRQLMAPRLPRH